MNITEDTLKQEVYPFIDKIKDLLSPSIWGNILMDCSKNEILILWLLYRREIVNMTQIAEYIHVPLNTATGIVARMEKRQLVIRERSAEDKRIVVIHLGQQGKEQIQQILQEIIHYVMKIMEAFTQEERELLFRMMDKTIKVMTEQRMEEDRAAEADKSKREENAGNKSSIRRITIE